MSALHQEIRQPILKPARRPRRWLRYTLLVVVALLLIGSLGTYTFAHRTLPQVSGKLTLPGLNAPVSVYRDEYGVPHIEATTPHDLYMAQGFVTAQDRMWEMDLTRRAASGRLSEVLGASTVSTDKFFRTLTLRQAAERSLTVYSAESRAALDAYADGVNAYIDQAAASHRLPLEFTLLGYTPEHWVPVDSLVVGKYMAYDLGGNMRGEVYHYLLRQKLGDALAQTLFPVYPADGVTILKAEDRTATTSQTAQLPPDDSHIDLSGLLAAADFPDPFLGSNNWVVSGALTKSGKPLLANDPHLGMQTPAIWYQTHLVLNSKDQKMNVIGVMFPGAPGLIIGHNDKIAWGVTNTNPDVQDLYIEKRNPQNPNQFEYMGKWEDAKVYNEPIKVKGQPDVPYKVTVTRHGPIVSEVVGNDQNRPDQALALRWTALLPTTELEAALNMDKAQNWQEFREALKLFEAPTQNFVFASVDGTIAYHAGGIVPIRKKGDGQVPVPGWTNEYEWRDYVPFDQMPEVVNPKDGFIATANNKVVDDSYPYFLTTSWAQPYRAARITEVLQSKKGLTADDMRTLQTDYTNLQARTLLPILLPQLTPVDLPAADNTALTLLKNWDDVDAADKAAPLIFQLWWKHLTQQLYEGKLGADLYKLMEDKGNVTDMALRNAAGGKSNDWIQAAGGLKKLAYDSFHAAILEGIGMQGKDPSKWQWGKFHQMQPPHPLGSAAKPLAWIFNPPAYPVGGSNLTVGALSYNSKTGIVTSGGVWRQVVDLADIAHNSRDVVTPGQSGNFMSKWFHSQEQLHLNGQNHLQALDPNDYRKGTLLTLNP
ncbi:MAG: penicillin acylase family protein [Mycobacterium leprae]